MAEYDFASLYEFLAHTPEQGLRKMLVDQKPITDVHFSLLLKIVRTGPSEFVEYASKESFPKIKMSPNEVKIKEAFWKDCWSAFGARGLLSPATKAA